MIVRFNVLNYLIGEGIRNLFKNKLSNYKDDSLEDIYNKLDDFEGRLI